MRFCLFCAKRVARRMTSAAMAKTLDQIGAAIPHCRLRCVSLEHTWLVKQRVPTRHQRTPVERKRQRAVWSIGAHWRLRHQISIERLQVSVGCLGGVRVRKCRIEMPSVAMDALTHGALEGGVGPGADPGLEVGRDIG